MPIHFPCTLHLSDTAYAITAPMPNHPDFMVAYASTTVPDRAQLNVAALTLITRLNRPTFTWSVVAISPTQDLLAAIRFRHENNAFNFVAPKNALSYLYTPVSTAVSMIQDPSRIFRCSSLIGTYTRAITQ